MDESQKSKEIFIKNKDKLLIATDDSNRQVKLQDIYESIGENQYLYMMFFNRWG